MLCSGHNEDALHVETNVVAGNTLLKLLVVHFDGLDFSGDVRGCERDDHSSFDGTSLDTSNRDSTDTTNFVDILKGKAEWLIGGSYWRFDGIDGIEESLALGSTTLAFLGPALIPWHAVTDGKLSALQLITVLCSLGRFLKHVITMPAGDGHKRHSLRVIANLFDESGSLFHNFVEAVLAPLE